MNNLIPVHVTIYCPFWSNNKQNHYNFKNLNDKKYLVLHNFKIVDLLFLSSYENTIAIYTCLLLLRAYTDFLLDGIVDLPINICFPSCNVTSSSCIICSLEYFPYKLLGLFYR